MKKLAYFLVILALLLVLVPATTIAHTEEDPLVVDLLAGQTEDIGDVKVWNDADNLYVQFVYEGPDCGFLEVHLQVDEGAWDEDILTNKGNPIPGQFERSHKPGFCFDEHTFTYNLSDEGFEVGESLMIAAHAALGLEESMTIISDTSTTVTEVNGTVVTANAVLANEPVGYPNCSSYAPDGTGSAWDSSVNIPGAHWIWNTLNPEHPIQGDVVKFQKTFTVPGLPNGGTLYITADNGYNVSLNGVPLGSAQLGAGFPGTLKETTDTTPQVGDWGVASQGWQSVESYSLLELTSGQNSLMITAANEYMWNTTDQYLGKDYYYGSWDPSGGSVNPDPFPGYGIGVDNICRNPGGLIFKATLDYYADGETAWGDGNRFNDKNWATYFTYTVQEPPPPKLTGYGVVTSSLMNYSDGGWAGWSVPSGVVLGGGFYLTGGPAAVSAPGTPGSVWPHYTFGAGEYGWVVRDDPDGASSPGSTVYALYADTPAGYEIVTSSAMAFGDGGYGGWSCPAGKVVLGGGFKATDRVAVSAPGTPGSVWPHYTFGAEEYGWVIRDAQDGASNSITVYAICANMLAGYEVIAAGGMNYSDGGWAGWSCPAGKVVTGGGFALTGLAAAVSAPGTPGSAWPHYTFGALEYGWVVRDAQDGVSSPGSTIYAICAIDP